MNAQQTMDTQAILRATFAQLMDGSPSEQVASELTELGVSEEAAQEVVARAVVILSDPRAREVVASTETQGKTAADVWEALVSSGVDRDAAQALVAEIVERRGRVEQKHRLVKEDWSRRKREANLDEARSRRKDAWRKIILGGVLLLPALEVVLANLVPGRRPIIFVLAPAVVFFYYAVFVVLGPAVVGIIYIGIGISRYRDADAIEKRQKGPNGG